MHVFPEECLFSSAYAKGKPQLVWTKCSADLDTPVSVALKFQSDTQNEKFCCLFESVEGGVNRARYSFIVLKPDLVWQCQNGKASISHLPDLTKFKPEKAEIFDSLRQLLDASKIEIPGELPPMAA